MFDAGWHEIVRLAGAAVGAALLWGIFASAVKRRGAPASLVLLIASGAVWYTGEGLAVLIRQGLGASSGAGYAAAIGRLGLSVAPSALVASLLSFAVGGGLRLADRLRRVLFPLALLPGLCCFAAGAVADTPAGRAAFTAYVVAALLLSAHLCRRLTDRYDLPVNQAFYRRMAAVLFGLAVLLAVAYPFGGVTRRADAPWLALIVFLSPLAPTFVLGNYVYRYSLFRIVVSPGLLYSGLTVVVLIVYMLGVRRLALAIGSANPAFRPIVVEAVLLGLLLALFLPVRNWLQDLLRRRFFRARFEYQQLIGELSGALSFPVDLDEKLRSVLDAVSAALKVNTIGLVLFDREEDEIRNLRTVYGAGLPGLPPPERLFDEGPDGQADIRRIADWLSRRREPLDVGQLHRGGVAEALSRRDIRICVPVAWEGRLTGFLCLGGKKREDPFAREERELLNTLCNQIALAVENADLIHQRLAVERRMFEAERLSSLGMLSASIAHEVRNPLSAIKSIATVLKERLGHDPGASEDLTMVLGEIERLSQTVNRLLRFARPDTEAPPVDLQLSAAVEDVVKILNHEAGRCNVTLQAEVDPATTVHCRSGDLKESLFNLILNGIQAIDPDVGGRVSITAEETGAAGAGQVRQEAGHWVTVTVSDTGPGISGSVGERVFDPFFTTKVAGSGLGLAIVRQDVERMGGTIVLGEAGPEHPGATFILRLPGAKHEEHRSDRG